MDIRGVCRYSLPEQRVELLAGVCERAAAHELRVTVEFLPWSPIPNLTAAVNLVKTVGANMGVNIDTWHHCRSGGTVQQLAEVDPNLIAAVQLNDVAAEPWDNLLEETAVGRLLPGAGCSDSVAVLKALHGAGVTAAINVEVFPGELMSLPAEEAAQKMADSMRTVFAHAAAS